MRILSTHVRSFGSYSNCDSMNLLRTELKCENFKIILVLGIKRNS